MVETDVLDVGPWQVSGVLYENCNCQLLCPAHVSFRQRCDNEICAGFWGIHVEDGRFEGLKLAEQNIVVLYESPQTMNTEDSWRMEIYFDRETDAAQRDALATILSGRAGGPWKILARFAAEPAASRLATIHYENDGKKIRLQIEGVLESSIDSVENRRTGRLATLRDLFNVIHSDTHYLATGSTVMKDGLFAWQTDRKHALHSRFAWSGP